MAHVGGRMHVQIRFRARCRRRRRRDDRAKGTGNSGPEEKAEGEERPAQIVSCRSAAEAAAAAAAVAAVVGERRRPRPFARRDFLRAVRQRAVRTFGRRGPVAV